VDTGIGQNPRPGRNTGMDTPENVLIIRRKEPLQNKGMQAVLFCFVMLCRGEEGGGVRKDGYARKRVHIIPGKVRRRNAKTV